MKTNASRFARRVGACGVVGAAALATVTYGCSSSSGSPASPPLGDDAAAPVGTDDGGSTPTNDGGGGTVGDAGGVALQKVNETNLFADVPGVAAQVDPLLLNAWGLAFNPTGIAWIADNHAGVATLYTPASPSPLPLVVRIPLPSGDGGAVYPAADSGVTSAPTGALFNPSGVAADGGVGDFRGDLFIFASEDGTVTGWQTSDGTQAKLEVDMSPAGAIFKGIAIVPSTPPVLLAADFHNGKIDAFDTSYAPVAAAGGAAPWVDPSVSPGYAPFNLYATTTNVFVTYAKQDADAEDDDKGDGHGAISVFNLDGTLVKSLVPQSTGNTLNSPWGLAIVPTGGWGGLPAGALLVGNFGDGTVHAFDPTSGKLVAALATSAGTPLSIDGLWALTWAPNSPAAADAGALPTQLYFTAGPSDEAHGLFGYLTVP